MLHPESVDERNRENCGNAAPQPAGTGEPRSRACIALQEGSETRRGAEIAARNTPQHPAFRGSDEIVHEGYVTQDRAGEAVTPLRHPPEPVRSRHFSLRYAPGDTLVMSRALFELAQKVPSVSFSGTAAELLEGTGVRLAPEAGTAVRMNEAIIRANGAARHYSAFYHEELARLSGVPLPVRDIRPVVALSSLDRESWRPAGAYVIISPGWKADMPVKAWPPRFWQATVDALRQHVEVVQIGAVSSRHTNPALTGVTSMVGRTSLRHLAALVGGSSACVSGTSMLMHLAAAFNRPCVVLAGGREPWWWTAYTRSVFEATTGLPIPEDFVPHDFLDSIGTMDCCKSRGCWKYTLEGRTKCLHLVPGEDRQYAQCLHEISPDLVFSRVLAAMDGIEFVKPLPASLTRETGISATENGQKRV